MTTEGRNAGVAGGMLGYASPTPLAVAGETFRDGPLLVAKDGVTLPPRCVLCGAPAHKGPIPLRFSWDTSFQMRRETSSLQLRQKGTVHAFFCVAHRGRWSKGYQVGLIGMGASIAAIAAGMVVAAISDASLIPRHTSTGILLAILGFALFILSMFIFTLRTRTLSCTRIDAGYLYLEGACERFLKPLRLLPGELARP